MLFDDANAFSQIVEERISQNEKWKREFGIWDEPNVIKLSVLGEEVGEVNTAVLNLMKLDLDEEEADENQVDDAKIQLRDELIQVAAVAMAWIEELDRALGVDNDGDADEPCDGE